MAAEMDVHFHWVVLPDWVLIPFAIAAVVIAALVWRATRRKGPPPLPRP